MTQLQGESFLQWNVVSHMEPEAKLPWFENTHCPFK